MIRRPRESPLFPSTTLSRSEQGSDVVLGKMRGVNGRGVPASMFRTTQSQADLYSSRVWWTLSATKLFRRSRSEEHTSELQSRQYLVCRLLLEKKQPNHHAKT